MRKTLPLVLMLVLAATGTAARAGGTWTWPVTGPVIRGYDPPDSPYGAGHRGIDIATPFGSPVVAAAPGTVSFAGKVGGNLFVSVNHGGGLASTYSWVSELRVRKNDVVAQGQVIALSGTGHPDVATPHLHFGVKLNGEYQDPMQYLSPGSVVDLIRLAPLVAQR